MPKFLEDLTPKDWFTIGSLMLTATVYVLLMYNQIQNANAKSAESIAAIKTEVKEMKQLADERMKIQKESNAEILRSVSDIRESLIRQETTLNHVGQTIGDLKQDLKEVKRAVK